MWYSDTRMKRASTSRRQINAELAVRAANQRAKEAIEAHTPKEEQARLKIDFYCECSNESCQERISLTLEDYEKLHDEQSKFVIAPGHITPSIEKVTKTRRSLQVVDKYAL